MGTAKCDEGLGGNENFQEALKQDADITSHLSAAEIDGAFTFDTYLRNVETIFDRVFGES